MKKPLNKNNTPPEPFFGLKYIAYCRTGLTSNTEDLDDEALVSFAKWQICKVRNILWNDPVWAEYTSPEILIEYFSIKFDENTELRADFEKSMNQVRESDMAWLEKMSEKYAPEKQGKIDKGIEQSQESQPAVIQEEFEDTF